MDKPNPEATGCAVCNPDLRTPFEDLQKRAEESLQIVKIGNRFHVLEISPDNNRVNEDWGSFETEFAAGLFRVNLVAEAANGNPRNACRSGSAFDFWEIAGRIFEIIKAHEGDADSLAREISDKEPWKLDVEFNPNDVEPAPNELELPF